MHPMHLLGTVITVFVMDAFRVKAARMNVPLVGRMIDSPIPADPKGGLLDSLFAPAAASK